MHYSHSKLKKLHADFHSLNNYEDRVLFFDQHFMIVPFEFPTFQTDLRLFFSDENFYRLYEILNFERNTKPLVREFIIDSERYLFSIRPLQNQVFAYNKYISAKFPGKEDDILARETAGATDAELLKKAGDMVTYTENRIKQGRGLDFKTQFMTLFLKGMREADSQEQSAMVYRKKKIIELYLYSMGQLYGRYLQALKRRTTEIELSFNKYRDPIPYEAEKKVLLLDELGCIDAIRSKYAFLSEAELNKKIAEVLSLITGDNWLKFAGFIGNVLTNKRRAD